MKTVAVLLAVFAVAQGGFLTNFFDQIGSMAIGQLNKLSQAELLAGYKVLCPNFQHPYNESVAGQNLHDAVQRMLSNPHPFSKGLTCQSIFSFEDYKQKLLAARPPAVIERSNATAVLSRRKRATVPAAVDWRTSGYVSPVQNQGSCGSCWSFSANGAMEGAIKRKTGKLVNLSEQNLVDCVTASSACDGGWMTDVYEYATKNGGVASETSYSYVGKLQTCKYAASGNAGTVASYDYTAQDDETDLMNKCATFGPIATAIDATYIQNYKSGVIGCPNFTALNHGVLIVGYGANSTSGEKYWIVKNSWGTSWGEQGYMRIARDKGNQCGIASAANYPIA